MPTSIGLNIITGRTGTAHVSSSDDAAIWRGFVGNDKTTLHTDQQLDLDYTTKGVLVVSDGVFCIGGRMGRISNTKTVEYGLPASGYYRRTLLLIRYEFDSTDDTETMTLRTLQNDPTSDTSGSDGASSAAVLPIATDPDNDFILYDFVADEDGIVSGTLKKKFVVMATVPTLSDNVSTLENHLANEVIERTEGDNLLAAGISRLSADVSNSKWEKLTITNNTISNAYDLYIITVRYAGRDEDEETTVLFDAYNANVRTYGVPAFMPSSGIMFRRFRIFTTANAVEIATAYVPSIHVTSWTTGTQYHNDSFTMVSAYGIKVKKN